MEPLLLRGKGPLFTNVCTKKLRGFKIAKNIKKTFQDSNLQYRQQEHDALSNYATEEAYKDTCFFQKTD